MLFFPTGREPLNVSPADVGRRLRIVHSDGATGEKDATTEGVLYRWTGGAKDGMLRIRDRFGLDTGIRANDIQEARVMAPEVSAFDMQRLAQQGWPPIESERVGDWDLRYSSGYSDRVNSVRVAARPTTRTLKSLMKFVEDWYGERGANPLLQIPQPSGMADSLEKMGWTQRRTSRLMVNSVSRLFSATASARERTDLDVEVRDQPNGEWYDLVSGYTPETAPEFHHVMDSVQPAAFVFCRNQSGELLGIGRATAQDTWCGATTIETKHQSRRRGIARAITGHMALWAKEQGATDWYLQVFNDNAAARAFYENAGFTTHHTYSYRSKDTDSSE